MRIPPSTRTKDDANKELLEIQLKINVENSKLEEIARRRGEAEEGFAAREIDLLSKEGALLRLEKKFDAAAGDAKKYYSIVSDKTIVCRKIIIDFEGKIDRLKEIYKEQKELFENNREKLNTEISTREKDKSNIDANLIVVGKNLFELNGEVSIRQSILEDIDRKIENRYVGVSKAELKNNSEGIRLEELKSDLRLWAVRLHNKYGKFMTEPENILINNLQIHG